MPHSTGISSSDAIVPLSPICGFPVSSPADSFRCLPAESLPTTPCRVRLPLFGSVVELELSFVPVPRRGCEGPGRRNHCPLPSSAGLWLLPPPVSPGPRPPSVTLASPLLAGPSVPSQTSHQSEGRPCVPHPPTGRLPALVCSQASSWNVQNGSPPPPLR